MNLLEIVAKVGPWFVGAFVGIVLFQLGRGLQKRPPTVNQDSFVGFKDKLEKETNDAIEKARTKLKEESDKALAEHFNSLANAAKSKDGQTP